MVHNHPHTELRTDNSINRMHRRPPATHEIGSYGAALVRVLIVAIGALLFLSPEPAQAENLVLNGSFETESASGTPQNFIKGRWGTNTTVFTYPAQGVSGRGASIEMTSRTTGDAKWAFPRISAEPGATYRYSDFYKASTPTYVTVEFKKSDGTLLYLDLLQPPAQSSFTQLESTFTVPAQVTEFTVFHLINSVGNLTVDNISVEKMSAPPSPPPPPSSSNLVPNPSVEIADASGTNPQSWSRGRWGTNTAVFTYPSPGIDGARAAKVTLSNYVSGDAKWFFNRVTPTAGKTYSFSNAYRSTVTSYVTAELTHSNGSKTYMDLAVLNPTGGSWETFSGTISVPLNATALTVFHLIKSNGSLEIDNYRLRQNATTFNQAYFTLTFDDGRRSTYDVGLPIVEAAGYKSTHFIISRRMNPQFPGYIQPDEVRDLDARGHEVGAHTRTHANLPTLTRAQMESEITGSKADLDALGVRPVVSFAYPYGAYNETVIDVVADSGFTSARTTQGGSNPPSQNPYILRRVAGDNATLASLKAEIDAAIAQKSWLVFAFHDITATPGSYNTAPDTLRGVVDYLKQKGAAVITMREGAELLEGP